MEKPLRKRRQFLLVLAGSGLLLFLAVIIFSNYFFQSRLARSLNEQFRKESQLGAAGVESLLTASRYEMDDLLNSREVTAYFENKALGMSELYGLNQSLAMVHARLMALIARKQNEGRGLYDRIALFDEQGGLLTDTAKDAGKADTSEQSEFPCFLEMKNPQQRTVYRGGDEILIATPCLSKGKVCGGIVAWLRSDSLLGMLENRMRTSEVSWTLMAETPEGYRLLSPVNDRGDAGKALPNSTAAVRSPYSRSYPMVELNTPIKDSPFVLRTWVPSGRLLGWNFPTFSIAGLAVLALAMLGGLASLARTSEAMLTVAVRLEETERHSEEITERNARLHEEMERRTVAEQTLQANSRLLERVITGAQVGTWDWNVQTGEVYINDLWAEMLGYRKEDLMPTTIATWVGLCHPDDLARSNELIGELLTGKLVHYECEVRMRHAEGHWIWVLDRGMVVEWDDEVNPVRASGTHLEITARKRAEEAREEGERLLFASNQRLEHVITGARVGTWDWNIGSGEIQVNDLWAEMLGYEVEEIGPVNFSLWERLCHPDDFARSNAMFEELFSGRISHYECEVRLRHADGRWIWVLDRGMVVEWDDEVNPVRASGTHLDITRRKEAEEARITSEQRLNAILSSMPDAVVLVDRERTILWANRACRNNYGEAVIGEKSWSLCLRQSSPTEVAFSRRAGGESTVHEEELEVVDPAGTRRVIQHMASVVSWDEAGAPNQLVEVFRDISERKALEEELRQKHQAETIGQLTGGIAHYLNNMLQAVGSYTECALMSLPKGSAAHDDLSHALASSEQAASLIAQLLAFGRRQIMQPAVHALGAVVEQLRGRLEDTLGDNIVVEYFSADDLWRVSVDRKMVEQVLVNLCRNAREAMATGGKVTIALENRDIREAERVRCSLPQSGPHVMMTVADTGCGMEPAVISRIFEPFYTTKPFGERKGLGLSTVYGNVWQHGGSVLVESKPGQGSRFSILFPALRDRLERTPASGRSGDAERKTILFAEDDTTVRSVGRRALEQAGYQVIEANDGQEAVELFKRKMDMIDLLLFDYCMPNMDGLDAYRVIRAIKPELPVVFASGYTANAFSSGLAPDDKVTILKKPYRPKELLGILRKSIESSHKTRFTASL